MTAKKFEMWVIEYLSKSLDKDRQAEFHEFLENNPEYKIEFNQLRMVWEKMDAYEVIEVSQDMDKQFYTKLSKITERRIDTNKNFLDRFQDRIYLFWKPQLAFGMILLCLGLGVGYYLGLSNKVNSGMAIGTEIEEVRQKLVINLLEQPSASRRLQGISEANKLEKVDEGVIRALLRTLNNDSNVNVRLASIEALANYGNVPLVREGIILAIEKQESPLVQITLANLMVKLQEKKSIEPIKRIIQKEEVDKSVRLKLESSIQQII